VRLLAASREQPRFNSLLLGSAIFGPRLRALAALYAPTLLVVSPAALVMIGVASLHGPEHLETRLMQLSTEPAMRAAG